MAEKPSYKILCWNRGKQNNIPIALSKAAWNNYLTKIIKSDPDIVFLQEEVSKSNSLFNNKEDYEQFFTRESTNLYNVVVTKKSVFDASLEYNISTFIMNFVCNECVFAVLKKLEIKNGEEIQKCITKLGPGDSAFELIQILKNVFYHFKDKDVMINKAFTNLCEKWSNFKHQKDEELHTFENFRTFLSQNQQNLPYADEISMKVCDRLCAVPLSCQPLEGGKKIKMIAVSGHLHNSSTLEKVNSVKSLFNFLNALGESTNCDAIIVGGDFNIDILDETEIAGEARQGFEIPKYDPTIHRAIHSRDYMCIDYFTYKNFNEDPNIPMITINDVKAKTVVVVPDLINVTGTGQYTINISQYESDFQTVRSASNHDPIEATLNHQITTSTNSSDGTHRSTSKKPRKRDEKDLQEVISTLQYNLISDDPVTDVV